MLVFGDVFAPYYPCMVYLPTFTRKSTIHVGKYTSPIGTVVYLCIWQVVEQAVEVPVTTVQEELVEVPVVEQAPRFSSDPKRRKVFSCLFFSGMAGFPFFPQKIQNIFSSWVFQFSNFSFLFFLVVFF